MWAGDLSEIRFTGERERNSGVFDLAVNDWAERAHTEQNIEPLRSHALVQNVN